MNGIFGLGAYFFSSPAAKERQAQEKVVQDVKNLTKDVEKSFGGYKIGVTQTQKNFFQNIKVKEQSIKLKEQDSVVGLIKVKEVHQ